MYIENRKRNKAESQAESDSERGQSFSDDTV